MVFAEVYAETHPQPLEPQNCLLIPPKYEYYEFITRLMAQGCTVQRAMEDLPGQNIERGAFMARPPSKEKRPASDRLPGDVLPIRCPSDPDAKAPPENDVRWFHLKPVVAGIYCGKGVTAGHLWHAEPMERCGIRYVLFDEKSMHLVENVDVVCFPSGGGYDGYISPEDQRKLKDAIHGRGLGFLGTCGGNVFGVRLGLLDASLLKTKQGFSYGLNMHGFANLETQTRHHPAMMSANGILRPFYYSGQTFSMVGKGVETLANYRDFEDCFTFDGKPYERETADRLFSGPAIISGCYGRGRVILSGPHPEIGEPQMFVDWIYYLGSGNSQRESDAGAAAPGMPESADRIPRSDWTRLLGSIDKMGETVGRLSRQLKMIQEDRDRAQQILGKAIFLLWLDMDVRLDRIRSTLETIGPETASVPKRGEPIHPDIQTLIKRVEIYDQTLDNLIPKVLNEVEQMRSPGYLMVHAEPESDQGTGAHGSGNGHHAGAHAPSGHADHEHTAPPIHYHAHPYMALVFQLKEPQVFLMGLDQTLKRVSAGAENEVLSKTLGNQDPRNVSRPAL